MRILPPGPAAPPGGRRHAGHGRGQNGRGADWQASAPSPSDPRRSGGSRESSSVGGEVAARPGRGHAGPRRRCGSALPVPEDQPTRSMWARLAVKGREGLVQQDHGSVLNDQPREQQPLELPDRQGADRPSLETLQAESCTERALGLRALLARDGKPRNQPTLFQWPSSTVSRTEIGNERSISAAVAAGRRCAWPCIRCGLRCAAPARAAPSGACSCRRRWARRWPSSRRPGSRPTRGAPPGGGRSSRSGRSGEGPPSQRPPDGEPQHRRHRERGRDAGGRAHGEQGSAGRDGFVHGPREWDRDHIVIMLPCAESSNARSHGFLTVC